MSGITITIDDEELRAKLNRLARRLDNLRPVMREIGEIVLLSVKQNFEAQGRPAWRKSKRALQTGGQTLSDTGRLRNSITYRVNAKSVLIGTNVKYAQFLQLGTSPYIIRPRNAQALRIPGIGFRKKVNHPGLTPRPFLVVRRDDIDEILDVIEDYLDM